MAVQVPGTLRVVERSGRYGQFCVGELACDIGTFNVRNKILDEFTAGTYEGIFSVIRIHNDTNVSRTGQVYVNLSAQLDWDALRILLQDDQEPESESLNIAAALSCVSDTQQEEVPVKVEVSTPKPLVDSPENTVPEKTVIHTEAVDDTKNDKVDSVEVLFELISNNTSVISLDNSVERTVFTELRSMVKEHGYRFEPNSKTWIKKV